MLIIKLEILESSTISDINIEVVGTLNFIKILNKLYIHHRSIFNIYVKSVQD